MSAYLSRLLQEILMAMTGKRTAMVAEIRPPTLRP